VSLVDGKEPMLFGTASHSTDGMLRPRLRNCNADCVKLVKQWRDGHLMMHDRQDLRIRFGLNLALL